MNKRITILIAVLLIGITPLLNAQWITNDVNWLGASDITNVKHGQFKVLNI